MDSMEFKLELNKKTVLRKLEFLRNNQLRVILLTLALISVISFLFYYSNHLGTAYNDARSHLNIGRRVVEGLKTGAAQLGSVWLPLPHILMIPTIWNDFFWHTGLAGAFQSMIAFLSTALLLALILRHLKVGFWGIITAIIIFALNLNVLYLQSTAMTELLLIATTTASCYYLLLWHKTEKVVDLVKSGFWTMLATLTRYDGWFLLLMSAGLVGLQSFRKHGLKTAEGIFILFCTLAGLGVALWFIWNQLIFNDALYFAYGPYSAHTQQQQLESAGNLATKGNLFYSIQIYFYAIFYNMGTYIVSLGFLGAAIFYLSKKVDLSTKFATTALAAPFLFNILALYLGHSVLFIQGLSGNSWFNVRYGITLIPFIAVFSGILVDRLKLLRPILIGSIILMLMFQFLSFDAVTLDDARVGSSQKNVSQVSTWLDKNAKDKEGFVLISVASHDAILFASNLPMKKFIHEGTGKYWDQATTTPDKWARWIIMRTYDENDSTYRLIKNTKGFERYNLVQSYPFADIYQLKDEYLSDLNTKPVANQK